ncbi:hypothetical protein HPP92_020058 [Vanilla planifolia]|uniref:Cucumisin n=1 Tax=Vanilla planifolia TaxID=51239 RepID=A0A835UJX2_VANPL|nr:hypothetical protein HPP92_020058 [Vanilla planifolia]
MSFDVLLVKALTRGRLVYIVYLDGVRSENALPVKSLHESILSRVIERDGASERLIHSYTKSFNAFAAMLSDSEAKILSDLDDVVSVFQNKQNEHHTTRSWDFLGLPLAAPRAALESDVIVGMFDTGIWPEAKSFDDAGFGLPPTKWKGTCQSNHNFTCNNKIIGARYYHLNGNLTEGNIASPRDTSGHGTHTSSIAAGHVLPNTSLSGLAEGTLRGGVPSARLAVYKVCWDDEGCSDADLLAAFDDAIADGVDIISISIGYSSPRDYFSDPIAIGSFHAVKNGILVSSSAGNYGPGASTVTNFAPWLLTVAASTIDRKFVAQVKLGNGQSYQGMAINLDGDDNVQYPLVYGGNVPNKTAGFDGSSSRFCKDGTLDGKLSKGKVIICDSLSYGSGPKHAGAVGAVMKTTDVNDYAVDFKLPVSVLGTNDSAKVLAYANKTSQPTASVSKSEGVLDEDAPYVLSFSSWGPNPITPNVLKPDLSAPGVDILAAWSPISKTFSGSFLILTGTSMSCPHASGSAAYVKSFNPTWSPAAIKSALITTANTMSPTKNRQAEFAYGAGQVNPIAALKPGLVYDAGKFDYVEFLCGQGYSSKNLRRVTGDSSSCTSENNGTVFDLNYPTFALSATKGKNFSAAYRRTVTNVGLSNSTYHASVASPTGLKIHVDPQVLSFRRLLEKKSFVLKIKGKASKAILSATLVWSDGVHNVRSPIVVHATA